MGDSMKKATGCFSIFITIVFGIIIPVICITVAAVYHDQCPAQPKINIYLYVAGAFGFVSASYAIFTMCCISSQCCQDNEGGMAIGFMVFVAIEVIISLFLFAWFITGSVWVYSIYPNYESLNCNQTLYKFAFGLLTAQWVLFGLKLLSSCLQKCCGGSDN